MTTRLLHRLLRGVALGNVIPAFATGVAKDSCADAAEAKYHE